MGKTILLVDDEEIILHALKTLFSREGFRVLTATCGEDALELVEQEEVDVVISDERMPGITGIDLLYRIKKRYPDKIRIMLTAFAELNTMLSAVNKVEAHRLIIKPYRNDELLQTVNTLILRREKARKEDLALEAAKREADFAYEAAQVICDIRLPWKEKYARVLNLFKEYIAAGNLSFMTLHPERMDLEVQAATNKKILGFRQPLEKNAIASVVAREQRPCRSTGGSDILSRFNLHDHSFSHYRNRVFLSVPILHKNLTVGVLNFSDPMNGEITLASEKVISHLTHWISAMIPSRSDVTQPRSE